MKLLLQNKTLHITISATTLQHAPQQDNHKTTNKCTQHSTSAPVIPTGVYPQMPIPLGCIASGG